MVIQNLSPVAQQVLLGSHFSPKGLYISPEQNEIVALRLLDLLSSKQGYIRRKGHTFRTLHFYERMLPQLLPIIEAGRPLILSAICLSPNFTNAQLCGESPYPHMASYIALENLHKIALAIRGIYPPGVRFVLGYEGYLVQPLYFHSTEVLRNTLIVFNELNRMAHEKVNSTESINPVQIVDAKWMIEQAFGNYALFDNEVQKNAQQIPEESLEAWRKWYETVVPVSHFPSESIRSAFIQDKSKWRAAVRQLHYQGGMHDKGFVGFSQDAIPFSPAGRHISMIALQLVPRNSYLPHQRPITFEPRERRWRMMSYADIKTSKTYTCPGIYRSTPIRSITKNMPLLHNFSVAA